MKVSIITASFNSASTIVDTIRSVLAQTYPDIEYWVIDGGSSDRTLEIVREYESQFKGRLHYVSEKDRGIYDAMNKGIGKSTGEVVGILNSDDYFTDAYVVENVVRVLNNNKTLDAVYGDIHFIRDGEPDKVVRYYSSASFHPWKLRFGFMPAHPSFYVRRKIYEENGLYALDYKIAADYDMMVRLFHKVRIRAQYLKQDFVTMRVGGMSTKNVRNRLLINKEDVKACRRYGLYTNLFFISLKYFFKIFEFLRIG